MSNYFEIIDNCPDGARLGDSSGAKWAAHGATPCGRQTAPTAITLSTSGDTAGLITDSSALRDAVNLIRTALVNKGIVG